MAKQRQRHHLDHRRGRDDLPFGRQRGLLVDVHDFKTEPSFEMLFTQPPQVFHGGQRPGRLSGDVEPQYVLLNRRLLGSLGPAAALFHLAPSRVPRSSPTTTFSRSERSPMILRIGTGSLRTSVGIARI